MPAYLTLLTLAVSSCSTIFAQCSLLVPSTEGYQVEGAPTLCPSTYIYELNIEYTIQFTGSNIPGSLTSLSGAIDSEGASRIFFDLPQTPSSGSQLWIPARTPAAIS